MVNTDAAHAIYNGPARFYEKRNQTAKEDMKHELMNLTVACATLCMTTSCGIFKSAEEKDSMYDKTEKDMKAMYIDISGKQRDMIRRNNEFALNVFNMTTGHKSNVLSPASISFLMAMLANGADGATRDEIMKTIGAEGCTTDELNELYAFIMKRSMTADNATTVNIANYIALNKHLSLKKDYRKCVKDIYGGGIEALDFASPEAAGRINKWCGEQTDGMIPQIIDETSPAALAYVLNAIYFNGTWQKQFDERQTKEEQFFAYTRDIRHVKMMNRQAKYNYMKDGKFAALTMPYGNGSFAMTVLLPDEGSSIKEMMAGLSAEKLADVKSKMSEYTVNLKLPRFNTETRQELKEIISKAGAPSMFNQEKADFRKMAEGGIAVSEMFQKAKIEVSEKGTKAAAVTMGVMTMSLRPQQTQRVEFCCNRPFVYLITDTYTGTILFMGQYMGD